MALTRHGKQVVIAKGIFTEIVERFSGKRGGSSVGSNSFRLYEFREKLNEKTA